MCAVRELTPHASGIGPSQTFLYVVAYAEPQVFVTVGSDIAGMALPSYPAREFATLIAAGMTPMQAIQAGTRVNAELLGWDDRLGTIEPGKLADIIAVRDDPLTDIAELERVIFVMLNGEVVVKPASQ